LFLNPDHPDRDLGNSNYGVRANTLVSGWDLAAFYYRSSSTQPTFYRLPSATPGQPFVFQPRFDRIWQVGGTLSKDLGESVVRAEAVYANGQGYSVTSLNVPQGVVQRNTLDYIVSIEFALPGDTRLNLQGFQRAFFGGSASDNVIKSDGFGASVFLSTKLTESVEPQILWIQNFKDAGGMIRPRINWYPAKNTALGFGVDIFTGPSDGYFGRYNNRDRSMQRFDWISSLPWGARSRQARHALIRMAGSSASAAAEAAIQSVRRDNRRRRRAISTVHLHARRTSHCRQWQSPARGHRKRHGAD
jgi:hypothetical protein